MPMKYPAHPGTLVRDNLEELGMSVAEAAKAIEVTKRRLQKVSTGETAVSAEMAVRFEKAFGGSAAMWMRVQSDFDLARARERVGDIRRLEPKVA